MAFAHPAFDNRVSHDLGVEIPIVQAPMGWIARSQLASAVCRAGAFGIIETSSGELDAVKAEIAAMRDLTDRPFGVNIAQAFVRDPAIAEFVIDQGVKFVTTSAGSPTKYTGVLKEAGLTVYHVVPTLGRGTQGGRCRSRRPGGGRRRRRGLQEPDAGLDDGAAAAGAIAGRPADHRRRRDRRRRHDGGRLRARRRGRADGHAHGVGSRVAGARTTGSRRSSTPPRPTRSCSTTVIPRRYAPCVPSARRSSATPTST